jgi:hypothetical protein
MQLGGTASAASATQSVLQVSVQVVSHSALAVAVQRLSQLV